MWYLNKYNKLVNVTKKRGRLTDIENKLVVTSGIRGRGNIGVGELEVQIIECKKVSGMYCTTWEI